MTATEVTAAIVDDESHARERLRRLMARQENVRIVAECASGAEAIATVDRLRPQLLLLDIQMPEMSGLAVVRALKPDVLPLVIFVTAFDQHAVEAFEVHAVDYLLKPVEGPRLGEALSRARKRLGNGAANAAAIAAFAAGQVLRPAEPLAMEPVLRGHEQDRFIIRHDGRLKPIKASEILWIEAQGNYARINLPDRQSYLVRETMANLEQRLNPSVFARIHRSTIVNLDAVTELQPWFGGDYVVILKTGGRLKASRHYRSRLDRWTLG